MIKAITVREMIEILGRFDPDLPVEMSMNMEYGSEVTEDMIEVFTSLEGERMLMITDTPGI